MSIGVRFTFIRLFNLFKYSCFEPSIRLTRLQIELCWAADIFLQAKIKSQQFRVLLKFLVRNESKADEDEMFVKIVSFQVCLLRTTSVHKFRISSYLCS